MATRERTLSSQAEELTPPVRGRERRVSRGLTDPDVQNSQAEMLTSIENDLAEAEQQSDGNAGVKQADVEPDTGDDDALTQDVSLHDSPPKGMPTSRNTNLLSLPDPPTGIGGRSRTVSDITPEMRHASGARDRSTSNVSATSGTSGGSGPDLRWQRGILRKRGTFFLVEFPEHGMLKAERMVFSFKAHRGSANALKRAVYFQEKRSAERTKLWNEQSVDPMSKQFVDGLYEMSREFMELVKVDVAPQHIAALSSGNVLVDRSQFESTIDYNWASGHCVQSELPPFDSSVQALAFDDYHIAVGTFSGEVTLWKWSSLPDQYGSRSGLASGVVFESPGGRCKALALSARYLISGTTLKTLALWDLDSSKLLGIKQNAHSAPITVVEFSPDEKMLATGSQDTSFKLWVIDSENRLECKKSYNWVGSTITCCSYQSDKIAIGYANGAVIIATHDGVSADLSLQAAIECHTSPVHCIQLSGLTVATGSDGKIIIWQIADGRPSEIAEGTTKTLVSRGTLQASNTGTAVSALQFEGDRLVAACGKQLQVWNLANAQVMYFREQTQGKIVCLEFHGATLVSAGYPGTVTIWDFSEQPASQANA